MIKELSVLLVEDDDVAAESVMRSLKKVSPEIHIITAENGRVALDVIKNKIPDRLIATPYIVLLDLNMPVMSGHEFLEEIRRSDEYRDIVVFVLTTSDDDRDRSQAYHHNIAGYMVKSAVGPQFSKLSALLDAYRKAIELSPR
ncbi:response regulator [Pseudomonas sp. HK3]